MLLLLYGTWTPTYLGWGGEGWGGGEEGRRGGGEEGDRKDGRRIEEEQEGPAGEVCEC
jgi:hypothetical protein